MSGKNPFKIIEEENIIQFQKKGPRRPAFLDAINSDPIKTDKLSSDSPDFPSFY